VSKRRNPVAGQTSLMVNGAAPEQDKHEKMLSTMHDALYTLGSKIRKPFGGGQGDKLLPPDLVPQEPVEARAARLHIESLHHAMIGLRRKK
jgi:hypothetical protein